MAQYTGNSIAGGDGSVFIDVGGTWANIKSQTVGTAQAATDPVNAYTGNLGGGTNRSISRVFLPFDTTSIPSGTTITAATITINVSALPGAGTGGTFHIVESTEANTSSLANNDFANVSGAFATMTTLGSLAITTTGSKVITLNATGLTKIIAGGITKLALVEDHDVTNTDPGNASDFRITLNTSENATVGSRPLLTVTYPGGGAFLFNFM